MYVPDHFAEARLPVLYEFMRANPFAVMVTHSEGRCDADHVPVLLDVGANGTAVLRGHVAKPNPVWRRVADGAEVLAIFRGVHRYISPGYYPSKLEHGKVVPTWNYAVVHARGAITWTRDSQWLAELLARLTDIHEKDSAVPWKLSDAPAQYVAAMQEGVVGFEIAIGELIGKWKMSQNRNAADRAGVISALAGSPDADDRAMAAMIAEAKVEP